ncbi:MAG TPA: hypothetical protein VD704_05375 [Gaiellaceae bacterium]|nr:hypothetical protein [Gaiellaceae bacterium]
MQDHAAPPREFGTGLRARLERLDRVDARPSLPGSHDLVRLCADEPPSPQPPPTEPVLAHRGAAGAAAA